MDDDWTKKIDPLKNLGGFSSSGSFGSNVNNGIRLGKMITAVITGHFAKKRYNEEIERRREEQAEILRNPPPIHGSAHWATSAELTAQRYLVPPEAWDHPSSILLGGHQDPQLLDAVTADVHWDGVGHLLTVAPTRTGKSETTIIANLVRYRGSCVVLDPKGELYARTAARRREFGPVYRIAPFAVQTDSFNPLTSIRRASDARKLADQIIPYDPKSSDFFRKDAIAFLAALLIHVVQRSPEERMTMTEIRRLTSLPLQDFGAVVRSMAASPVPAVASAANIVLGKDPAKSVPALRETLNTEMSLWDDRELADATCRSDFSFEMLKDRTATVYIEIPFSKMSAYAPFLRILLLSALDAMIENPNIPEIPVLFVLDEFLKLGYFPQFMEAINTHAGSGVRLWFFLQNLAKLKADYGESWTTFLDAKVKQFFGTDDIYTGEIVSKILGSETVARKQSKYSNSKQEHNGDVISDQMTSSGSLEFGVDLTGKPLLTPDEVVRLLNAHNPDFSRTSIVCLPSAPPLKATLTPWRLKDGIAKLVTQQAKPGKA